MGIFTQPHVDKSLFAHAINVPVSKFSFHVLPLNAKQKFIHLAKLSGNTSGLITTPYESKGLQQLPEFNSDLTNDKINNILDIIETRKKNRKKSEPKFESTEPEALPEALPIPPPPEFEDVKQTITPKPKHISTKDIEQYKKAGRKERAAERRRLAIETGRPAKSFTTYELNKSISKRKELETQPTMTEYFKIKKPKYPLPLTPDESFMESGEGVKLLKKHLLNHVRNHFKKTYKKGMGIKEYMQRIHKDNNLILNQAKTTMGAGPWSDMFFSIGKSILPNIASSLVKKFTRPTSHADVLRKELERPDLTPEERLEILNEHAKFNKKPKY